MRTYPTPQGEYWAKTTGLNYRGHGGRYHLWHDGVSSCIVARYETPSRFTRKEQPVKACHYCINRTQPRQGMPSRRSKSMVEQLMDAKA